MSALETIELVKAFRGVRAVDHLSIAVPEYAIYGFLGANGAGKTTALRLVLGLLRADRGEIRLFDRDVDSARSRNEIGALIEMPSLYPHLTGRENLDLTRRILGQDVGEIDRALRIVGLAHAGRQRVGGYSLGMKQRLALARAMLGRPRLLILDEPTNGLDPAGIADMRDLLRRLPDTEEATLIVSSHLLNEIQEVATYVGLMHRGRLLVQEPIATLLAGNRDILVGTSDPAASSAILERAGYAVNAVDGMLSVGPGYPTQMSDPGPIAGLLVAKGICLTHLERRKPRLEDVYHRAIARVAA